MDGLGDIRTVEYYTAMQKAEQLHATAQKTLADVILSERGQTPKSVC